MSFGSTSPLTLCGVLLAAWCTVGLAGMVRPLSLAFVGRTLFPLGALVGAALAVVAATSLSQVNEQLVLPIGLPDLPVHLRLDGLSGVFLILLGATSAGISIFAAGYFRQGEGTAPGLLCLQYHLFLASMGFVLLADDAYAFMLAWETMALSSYFLVTTQHRIPEIRKAGFLYLLMAHLGAIAILLSFGILQGGSWHFTFDAMRNAHLSTNWATVAFCLALLGFGAKAGLVPLHVWLPIAHPAAPSHVSALMSGVMTKIAIYAFIRIVFDLLGPNPWWAGTVVLALGGVTAVLGVLHALMERDLKRLLAYSTVENIGIIFIGLGLALAFRANGFEAGAALALTAALFHALNHTLFKSLLFFGAGAVLNATGERDMETMGGLIHRMPRTAIAFLVGCVAISALPPLNGFASEWLTFQAVLLRPEMPQWGLKLMLPVDGALLALAAALAAACFVRAFGICFLGRPRSDAAARALEVDPWSLTAMGGFALLCLLAGILPGAVIDSLAPVAQALAEAHMPVQLADPWLTIAPIAASRSSYNGLLVFGFIALSMMLTAGVVHRVSRGVRRAPP